MLPALISLLIATLVAVKVRNPWRFASFVLVLLMVMPCMAYIVTGTQMILAEMSGSQVVYDFLSIAQQCYTEPFKLALSDGAEPLNPTFAVTGILVILSSLVSVGQFVSYLAQQRDKQESKSH